jgi:hypothetical protein
MIKFHGGCFDCTQQEKHGTDFCFDCCYFAADWSKPSLNDKPPSQADIERQLVINRRMAMPRLLSAHQVQIEWPRRIADWLRFVKR